MVRALELDRAKRGSMVQVMFRCARLLNEFAIGMVRERSGQSQLRVAHTTLFPHIDLEGTRLTEIARRVGVSKQAVAQLVSELEEMGMIERVPDPSDGRAKLIRYSAQGGEWLFAGLSVLKEIEEVLGSHVGVEAIAQMHDTLLRIQDVLDDGRLAVGRKPD